MRVQIAKRLLGNDSGPGNFARRLSREFNRTGVKVVTAKPDIFLDGISLSTRPVGSKVVFRVDGCYYEKSRLHLNSGIRKGIENADGVVYQSHFSRLMANRMLNARDRLSDVIYNGFDQSLVKNIKPAERPFLVTFVAVATWRATKRPGPIIEAFRRVDKGIGLVMIGPDAPKVKDKHLIRTGDLSPKEVWRWYKASDWMVHMSFLDSCPNAVVEALSFGLPVICNNIGGTPEIVGGSGEVVNCDRFDFKPVSGIKDFDPALLVDAIRYACDHRSRVCRADLDISVTAQKYMTFFKKVLHE